MGKLEGIVGVAGILGLVSFSTLIQRVYKTHNTTSLPWAWVIMNICAQALSFTYGVVNGAYGIYIPNSLFLLGLFYILYVKLYTEDSPTATTATPKKNAKHENMQTNMHPDNMDPAMHERY
jgi:uncharacterized protein with PQ loop repeat